MSNATKEFAWDAVWAVGIVFASLNFSRMGVSQSWDFSPATIGISFTAGIALIVLQRFFRWAAKQ